MGVPDESESSKETVSLTPFGEACSKRDLSSIHEILERLGYKDDEDVANEVIQIFSRFPSHVLILLRDKRRMLW